MNDNLVTTLLILVLLWVVSKVAEIAEHEIKSIPAHNFSIQNI
jgi:hypothetical protein